jgi:hypothetical protein
LEKEGLRFRPYRPRYLIAFERCRTSVSEINAICPGYSQSLNGSGLEAWVQRYVKEIDKRRKEAKQEAEVWLEMQREAGRTWKRWEQWRRRAPVQAEYWRSQHQDKYGGDLSWMIRFAKPHSAKARQALESALKQDLEICPEVSEYPPVACRTCRGTRFWRKCGGYWVCARCHPPAVPQDIDRWSGPVLVESAAEVAARQGHTIDPTTGVYKISEWRSECMRAFVTRRFISNKDKDKKDRVKKTDRGTEWDTSWWASE